MPLILNIDTATESASVCLSQDLEILAFEQSDDQKNHASFLQPAIRCLFSASNKTLEQIDAVAVTVGPGSYTGLRVGLASAKGLCYVLKKPLILLDTLHVMANATFATDAEIIKTEKELLFCPAIDARRMEIFTALYNINLENILPACALIVDENSFCNELKKHKILFSGSGKIKIQKTITNSNTLFSNVVYNACHMTSISLKSFADNSFANIAYSQPFYLKEFFTPAKSIKNRH